MSECANKKTGKRHPKTDAIVLSYLQGKCHKDVAREHDMRRNSGPVREMSAGAEKAN